ncbi:MAG: hypothetical protein RBT41_03625 [Clostridia bacterium]|jgi:hypothetical protein|nr:hypothetical protein [Clostridia bacterium]
MSHKKRSRFVFKRNIPVLPLLFLLLALSWPFSPAVSSAKYILSESYLIHISSANKYPLTALGASSGSAKAGETLTAGALSPVGATAVYQWQKSAVAEGPYENIPEATGSVYTLTHYDAGYYIRVSAVGTGHYSGTVTSVPSGPVLEGLIPLESIGAINGTLQVGHLLSAGEVSPGGATVHYQWQRAGASAGEYADIAGATETLYRLSADDHNKYIRVIATGYGEYVGTVTSASRGPVAAAVLTALAPITGTTEAGYTLTAGAVTPDGATVTYQWLRSSSANGTYAAISGATNSAYTLVSADNNQYIKVVVTGTGAYTGSITSSYKGPVRAAIALTAIGPVTGTPQAGQPLTAGALSPAGATAVYQWQSADTPGGAYTNIPGATSTVYTPGASELDKYVRVVATGNGDYKGTVTSAAFGPIAKGQLTAISPIIGTSQVGHTLAAGTLTPLQATVTYQWQAADSPEGTYVNIPGATSATYHLTTSQLNKYLRLIATGTGSYTGTVSSPAIGPVVTEVISLTAMEAIAGTLNIGQVLSAGALSPAGASATYQWQRGDTADGVYLPISGATSAIYTLTAEDYHKFIKVVATGSGGYAGSITSAAAGPVTEAQLTYVANIIGTTEVGYTLTAGEMSPVDATVTYQWQRSSSLTGTYQNITGATARTYTLTSAENMAFVRVVVTGNGVYAGSVTSLAVGPIRTATPITAIEPINGTAQLGATLTAGALTPAGATAVYQWHISDTLNGVYTDIAGATSNTYTPVTADYNKYLKVSATGTGTFKATVTSAAKGPITVGTLTAIGPVGGTAQTGGTLTAGALTPPGATVTYQWKISSALGGVYQDIPGATGSMYTPVTGDLNKYIKVVATGTGSYAGTAESAAVGPIVSEVMPLTGIGEINGTRQVEQSLAAGALLPAGAAATYQWQRSDTADGVYQIISGATASIYTLTGSDYNKYIKVVATGAGSYSGTVISAAAGPIAAAPLTAVASITGTTEVGYTLYTGALTPAAATVNYQWQTSTSANGPFTNLSGATGSSYPLHQSNNGAYIRVSATGSGGYFGTVFSPAVGPIKAAIPLASIASIGGTAQVGLTLTAGAVNPLPATVTYQWKRADTPDGYYQDILGATGNTYTPVAGDCDKYLKVAATGTGNYKGTVTSAPKGPVTLGVITAIAPIGGTAQMDETLTAGLVSPAGATVTYQWQRAALTGGPWQNIEGAVSNTYIPVAEDLNKFIRVIAAGSQYYTGTVNSAPIGPVGVETTPLTDVGAINGIVQVGGILEPGQLSPTGATATYQWQRCDTADGVYINIPGAMGNTYTPVAGDFNKFLKVAATGSGSYSGTVFSASAGPVEAGTLTAIGPISGSLQVGYTLTAGALSPAGATVTYQWQRSNAPDGVFQNITGAIGTSYTLTTAENWAFIRVVVTGTGGYSGTVTSAAVGPARGAEPLTAIGAISGSAKVGSILTAGSLTPMGATVLYQWQVSDAADGVYEDVFGATGNTYIPVAGDFNKYLRVTATGTGEFRDTVTSEAKGPVTLGTITAIAPISGVAQIGDTLTAGALTPAGATAAYQWRIASSLNGVYTDIPGATEITYSPSPSDLNKYLKVTATGIGNYTGTVTSAATGPVVNEVIPLTGIGSVNGIPQVEEILAAGAVTPAGAAVTYQWQRSDSAGGVYQNIAGANAPAYALKESDYNKFFRVAVTGTGGYTGIAVSAAVGPVAAAPLTYIGPISGSLQAGYTLVAGAVSPPGATVTYQWQRSLDQYPDSGYQNINGATAATYLLTSSENWRHVRVVVTGTGGYIGTLTSAPSGRIENRAVSLTAIGPISGSIQVGKTLTAGILTPSAATALYQWQSAAAEDGTYSNIVGATGNTYTLTSGEYNEYIRVLAIGTGEYKDTVASAAVGPVTLGAISAIGPVSGSAEVGGTLTAGPLSPAGATATYQWQIADTSGGAYGNIDGATENTYSPVESDLNKYIRVVATGTGNYTGTVTSAPTGPIMEEVTPLAGIGAISGAVRMGVALTAGNLFPAGATATYQWQKCNSADGIYTAIPGATGLIYTPGLDDLNKYIKVAATGSGVFTGTVTSAAVGPVEVAPLVSIGPPGGSLEVGYTLTAGVISPAGAIVTYQWQKGWSDTNYQNINGATGASIVIDAESAWYRVVVTGLNGYSGTLASAGVGPARIAADPLKAIGPVSGDPKVGGSLTAGALSPSGATAVYQWQIADTAGGAYSDIDGAVGNTYIPEPADEGRYLRVVATGTGLNKGAVTSSGVGPVEPEEQLMKMELLLTLPPPLNPEEEMLEKIELGEEETELIQEETELTPEESETLPGETELTLEESETPTVGTGTEPSDPETAEPPEESGTGSEKDGHSPEPDPEITTPPPAPRPEDEPEEDGPGDDPDPGPEPETPEPEHEPEEPAPEPEPDV